MQGDEEAPSKKNDQHQVEITVGSTSTTAASKQAKKRTARIGAGPMLFDEEPYSPSTKYNLGTHTPSSTFFFVLGTIHPKKSRSSYTNLYIYWNTTTLFIHFLFG